MVEGVFNLAAILYFNSRFHSGIAKYDRCCMQFADSGSQLHTAFNFVRAKNGISL